MARNVRNFIGGGGVAPMGDMTPKHLVKQEFGRRLAAHTFAKGWTQSELSRRSGVAKDSISTYIRGVTLPELKNLRLLADTLGVEMADLLPSAAEGAIEEDHPSLELKVSTVNAGVSWLRINRMVSTTSAMQIIDILNRDVVPKSAALGTLEKTPDAADRD